MTNTDEVFRLIKYIRKNHHLLIGERTAERLIEKIKLAAPSQNDYSEAITIRGRSLVSGNPMGLEITISEWREILSGKVNKRHRARRFKFFR